MKKLAFASLLAATIIPSMASAAAVTGHVDEALVGKLSSDFDVVLTHKDQVSGVSMVRLASSEIFFTNDNADFILGGQSIAMFKPFEQGMIDTSTPVNETFNKKIVNELVGDTGITLKAKDEKFKILAFVDPACGYCQKMHAELNDYLDAGITVQLVAYPIFGDVSKHLLESVMSESDPKKAVELLEKAELITKEQLGIDDIGDRIAKPTEGGAEVVRKHTEAGKMLGMRGTPGLVLESGKVISSYVPAQNLLSYLEAQAKAQAQPGI